MWQFDWKSMIFYSVSLHFLNFCWGGEKHVIAGAKVWPFLQSKRPESRFYQLLAQKIASTLIFISSTTCPHFWKTIFSHQIILVEMQKAKRWQQCEKAKEERRKVERKLGLQRKGDFWRKKPRRRNNGWIVDWKATKCASNWFGPRQPAVLASNRTSSNLWVSLSFHIRHLKGRSKFL